MMKTVLIALSGMMLLGSGYPKAEDIIDRVDKNMSSKTRVFESTMTVHGRRSSRTMTSKTWQEGSKQSFTEYHSPAREQGTKMLKLTNQLWIFSPSTDRIIEISGSMLRQSVMGSDLSYEDMMDDRKLTEVYTAAVSGEEKITDRNCWVLNLQAKVSDVAYQTRKIWIDMERYIPLKEELYAKSGQLLKRMEMKNVQQVDGRWFPTTILYRDMLKQGEGTEFSINSIKFNVEIPGYIFTKAALKK
jgi:outer membrane lipoprotein-sorting protein